MPWDKRERDALWYRDYIQPVTEALYVGEFSRAADLIAGGRVAIAEPAKFGGAVNCVKAALLLDYLEFHLHKARRSEQLPQLCADYERQLSQPAALPEADGLRRKLLLQLLCSAERVGHRRLTLPEFRALYDGVPEDDRNDEFWHYASTWAFHHGFSAILEQAYEEYSVNKGSFMTDWLWWRVRLMYLLSTGQAAENDVLQLLRHVTILGHLRDFDYSFVPRLKADGLYTEAVRDLEQVRTAVVGETTAEMIRAQLAE